MTKTIAPLLATSITLLSGTAFATDPAKPIPEQRPESGWMFAAAPYFWMAGMEGTVGQSDFLFDVVRHGPILGARISF